MNTWTGHTGAQVGFDAVGHGVPIVALHGAYSAREEMRAMIEPTQGLLGEHRRIYPDLPGMGDSPAHESIRTANDVVDLLDEFLHDEIGDGAFLVAGHSFGAHLARGLAARRVDQVAGLALICPLMPATMNSEPHVVVTTSGDPTEWLQPAFVDEYAGYFVVHTAATAARFRQAVAPVVGRFDGGTVERTMTDWGLKPDPDTVPFEQPTLVVTGRHDSFVGHRDQMALLDRYPRASYVVVADAGHALPHEHPKLVAELVDDWLDRCRER